MEKNPNPQVLEDFFTKDFISPLKSTQKHPENNPAVMQDPNEHSA